MTNFPTHNELWMPTVKALKELGGSGNIQEIFDKMVEIEGYSDDILNVTAADGRRS